MDMHKTYVYGGIFLAGTAIGAVIGAAAGLFLAPQSGRLSREQFKEWLKEKRHEGSDLLATLKEESARRKAQVAAVLKAGRQAYEQTGNVG